MQTNQSVGWTKAGIFSFLLLVALLAVWGVSIATWGYPAIILPALGLTFTGLIALVFVTRG